MPVAQTARRGLAIRIGAALGAALVLATAACGQADPDLPEVDAAPVGAAEELTRANVDAWLDETLPALLERDGIAGASVAVVGGGEVVTTRGFGYADTGEGGGAPVEVDPADTLFRAGSVAKVFTATAVMQLVASGDLDLDTDVSAYLDFEIERNFDDDLTLRHLLSHTPGFEERITGLIATEGEVDLREVLATDPPEQVYRPGTTPSYSNYGNSLAGYIVERVSGVPFEQYVEEHLFAPLGMDSSSFRQPLPEALRERVSNGYLDGDGPAQPFEIVGTPPAGSLSITADDMAQFMLAQLGTHPDGTELLDAATRELMYSPALTEETLGAFAGAQRMTLGWFEEDQNGHRIVGHGGDTNFFHTHLNLYLEDGAGIYLSLNSSGNAEARTLALRSAIMSGFADRFFPGESPAGDGTDASVDAEAIAGTYYSSRGFHSNFLNVIDLIGTVKIEALDDGRLYFPLDPVAEGPNVYEHIGADVWREIDGERAIAVRTENGEVTGIVQDAVITYLPMEADRELGLPLLLGAVAVLVLGLLAWPVAAVYRRLRHRPGPGREGRLWRALVRVGAVATLLALVGWAMIIMQILTLQDPATAAIRAVQALQVIGALGLVPAVLGLVGEIRRKAGWRAVTGTALTLLALSAVMNVAIQFQLLSPNITY
ncbi:serine hydrolase [Glycomyces sp. NRRL B-16210]|uniref:serine hydrolase domain-containing protein n=1 Tax=Glycomyces sp. NRRL B-16210 TaxID=1463821 RepID=UPI00068A78DF|nr:serine hydrolase domain-containing protein [Glycomyces sp. NRRL B-16210]